MGKQFWRFSRVTPAPENFEDLIITGGQVFSKEDAAEGGIQRYLEGL